jgi:hypothetical protein
MEQADDVLKPYYKTIRSLLNLRNEKDILHIFREENMECVWYSHDNWNGGIDYYHLQINVSPFLYDLKSASNLNGNLNCSKELEHYAS